MRVAAELGLIVGGALGNAIDRVAFGRVTDFVVWKLGTHEWDTFNVADAALVVGIIGLFFDGGRPSAAAGARPTRAALMRPVLFAFHAPLLGEVSFPAYFTLLTIGFGLAMILTVRESRRLGMDRERVLDTNLWMVVWGIIGARVLHLIADGHFHDYVNLCTNPKQVPAIDARHPYCTTAAQCGYDYLCDAATHKCYPPQDCFAAVKVWRGGLAYYGGFIFAVAFAYYYVRKYKLGWWRTADLAAPGIMLGLVCGRLGCFLNGCCYGKPTDARSLGVGLPAATRRAARRSTRRSSTSRSPASSSSSLLYYVVRPRRRAFGDVFAGCSSSTASAARSARSGATTTAASSSASSRRRRSSRSRSSPAASLLLVDARGREARHDLGVAPRPLQPPRLRLARLRAAHLRRRHRRRLPRRHLRRHAHRRAHRRGSRQGPRPLLLAPGLVAGRLAPASSSSPTSPTTCACAARAATACVALRVWEGGLVFYGGFFAALVVAVVYTRAPRT